MNSVHKEVKIYNVVDLTCTRGDQTITRELIEKLDKIEKNQEVMLKRLDSLEKL